MKNPTVFRINHPKVIHQTIEGEVVVINLDAGTYYSLRETGARIWQWVEQGASIPQILEVLPREFSMMESNWAETVTQFIAQLNEETLIVPEPKEQAVGTAPMSANTSPLPPFAKPVLQKFTDMQGLLLIDPIHEVQDAGWPHTPPVGEK